MSSSLFPIVYDEAANTTKETFTSNLDIYTRSMCSIMDNDVETRLAKPAAELGFHGERIRSFTDTGKVSVVNSTVSFSFTDAVANKYGSWECDAISEPCAGFYTVLTWVSRMFCFYFLELEPISLIIL